MAILQIQYRVADYASWKQIFDQDPMGRKPHGVTRHWIYQDADDPNHLMLSLEFSSAEEAKGFLNEPALQQVWDRSGAAQAWVLQEAEATTY
jgi:quinol monooxygenase YgiN